MKFERVVARETFVVETGFGPRRVVRGEVHELSNVAAHAARFEPVADGLELLRARVDVRGTRGGLELHVGRGRLITRAHPLANVADAFEVVG